MADEAMFINMYIKKLTDEVSELIKAKVLLDTKAQYNEQVVAELQKQVQTLQTAAEDHEKSVKHWEEHNARMEQSVAENQKNADRWQKDSTRKGETIDQLQAEIEKLKPIPESEKRRSNSKKAPKKDEPNLVLIK